MKTIPPQCPEPETVKYWKSIDQLQNTPEFESWLHREFPDGASEAGSSFDRRDFMKLMSASLAFAGLGVLGSGCRKPEQRIYPFSKLPEGYVHGSAKFYATAMPTRGSAIPLLVRSNDGRPTKIEGNPEHPDSNGGTDLFAQASILALYDADRAQRFTKGQGDLTAAQANDELASVAKAALAAQGAKLAFLLERSSSPSRVRLIQAIKSRMPNAKFYAYEPVDFDVHRQAASLATGKPVSPYFRFDVAKTVLSLDCDFIGGENDTYLHCRNFARSRRVNAKGDKMSRLYVAEALMTQTGMNADHRLRVASSQVVAIAAAIAAKVGVPGIDASKFPLPAHVKPQWIDECAKDLQLPGAAPLVVAGYRQPLAVHLLVNAINEKLGANRTTVQFRETPDLGEGTIGDLSVALTGGGVETLVILGGNPVFTAPADLAWAATQRKAKTVIRLGYYEDETFGVTDIHLPAAHYLETWGDARTADGTVVPIQPLIQPLFGGVSELEVLAHFAGVEADAHKIVRATTGLGEEAWKKFLHDGFLANSAVKPVDATANTALAVQALAAMTVTAPSAEKLEVVFTRDYTADDGRWANNGWLRELPDPVTKITWDNAIFISRKTAADLKLKNTQIVTVELGTGKVTGPVWVVPGQADNVLGLPVGYGRDKGGRIANFGNAKVGFNAYPLRTTQTGNIAVGAKLTPSNATHTFACTQDHWSLEGRTIIREGNLSQFEKHPDFVKELDFPEPPGGNQSLYPNPLDAKKKEALHQWGMAIDLSMCVGCNACTMACQSENNIPIVGKEQVRRGREMHWMRIDRYFTGNPEAEKKKSDNRETLKPEEKQYLQEWIDDPQAVNQPMLCQHCEAAPCESVCPVNATVHDEEGLNLMVYNRCVGTRYCSNNCPWKVRRFNYFDYNKRPIGPALYRPNFGFKHTKPEDEFELLKLVKNPDVSVRMRGVMEKCTFCVQRIESAKIAQKVKAGQSGDVIVPDGVIKTACQQACPAEAIVFGDVNDPKSKVSLAKKSPRDYTTLEFLHTKPRLTYLARLRNPNPAMPDYYDMPLTSKAYFEKAGHHDAHEGGAGSHSPAKKGEVKH